MKWPALLALLFVLGCSPRGGADASRPQLAIQPLGKVDRVVVRRVVEDLRETFAADVTLLPARPLPKEAYYAPRRRHRAEKILAYLERTTDRRFDKVLGLTSGDISVTARGHNDWGVFGFAGLNERPCVVSTFRLRPPNRLQRTLRVARHELGHTFGRPHCPNPKCVMEDAKGTVKSVDRGDGTFCAACRRELGAVLR